MTKKRKRVFTREWEKLIWRPFGRFLELLFLFLLVQVFGALSVVMLAVYILLGLLWFFSLGHIFLIKGWNSYLDRKVGPFLLNKLGRKLIRLLIGRSE